MLWLTPTLSMAIYSHHWDCSYKELLKPKLLKKLHKVAEVASGVASARDGEKYYCFGFAIGFHLDIKISIKSLIVNGLSTVP